MGWLGYNARYLEGPEGPLWASFTCLGVQSPRGGAFLSSPQRRRRHRAAAANGSANMAPPIWLRQYGSANICSTSLDCIAVWQFGRLAPWWPARRLSCAPRTTARGTGYTAFHVSQPLCHRLTLPRHASSLALLSCAWTGQLLYGTPLPYSRATIHKVTRPYGSRSLIAHTST